MATPAADSKTYWENRWENAQTNWRLRERQSNPFTLNVANTINALHGLADDERLADWLASLKPADGPNALTEIVRTALAGATVFVPLCGDSLVLSFFANDVGCNVIGVDIAEVSIRRAIAEQFADRTVKEDAATTAAGASLKRITLEPTTSHRGTVSLFIGDVFALMNDPSLIAGRVDFVYDRASFVAIDPSLRQDYTHAMRNVIGRRGMTDCRLNYDPDEPGVRCRVLMFINTIERPAGDDQLTAGPPFHVSADDVFFAYGGKAGAMIVPLPDEHLKEAAKDDPFTDALYAVVQPLRVNAATEDSVEEPYSP